jgi:hypothetical protein
MYRKVCEQAPHFLKISRVSSTGLSFGVFPEGLTTAGCIPALISNAPEAEAAVTVAEILINFRRLIDLFVAIL